MILDFKKQQIILLRGFKEIVYRELHITMVHIGADITIQLIRKKGSGQKWRKRSNLLLVMG